MARSWPAIGSVMRHGGRADECVQFGIQRKRAAHGRPFAFLSKRFAAIDQAPNISRPETSVACTAPVLSMASTRRIAAAGPIPVMTLI
jgi:hypothetical protein